MNQLEDALGAYNRAIELNPQYARAYANRGDIWRKMGKREDAIADYRHALSLDGNNKLALAGLKTLGIRPARRPRPAPQPARRRERIQFERGAEQVARTAPAARTRPPAAREKRRAAPAPGSSSRRKAIS